MLCERQAVCDALALSRWQSYQFFPASKTGFINEDSVLKLVNSRLKGLPHSFTFLPQLVSPEALSEATGAPVRKIKLWTHRKRQPIPHVHFNPHVLRFPLDAATAWLEEFSR